MAFENMNRPFTRAEMDSIRRATRDRDDESVLSDALRLALRLARRIPFAEDALALYFCARDPETETRAKLIILGALAYFILPIDIAPDAIPFLGFTDDAAVIAAAVAAVRNSVTDRHRGKAREALDGTGNV